MNSDEIQCLENFDLPSFNDSKFRVNPYKFYAKARDLSPVFYSKIHRQYFVLGAEVLEEVLKNPIFIVDTPFRASRVLFGRTIMDVDGEEHSRLRKITNSGFLPSKYSEYLSNIVKPAIEEYLKPIIERGYGDFVADFANHIPTKVMSKIIGIPSDNYSEFYKLSKPIINYLDSPTPDKLEVAKRSVSQLKGIIINACESKDDGFEDSILQHLLEAQKNGQDISSDEIVRQVGLLIPAAIDTTNRLIANALFLLTEHSEWQDKLRAFPELATLFVEEVMRLEPPIHSSIRISSQDTTLNGISIPRGSLLNINFASANRDPIRFTNPDEFNPMRIKVKKHFSFGGGKHQCMGRSFATQEVVSIIHMILEYDIKLTFTPETINLIEGGAFRSPEKLHLTLQNRSLQ